VALDVARAIDFLHRLSIAHLDIKPGVSVFPAFLPMLYMLYLLCKKEAPHSEESWAAPAQFTPFADTVQSTAC